ncbi:MAG: hypothetical protein KBB39_05405 [Phycicoccus sp.]|nr:hypothetical protein [Phycicoccus sp.]
MTSDRDDLAAGLVLATMDTGEPPPADAPEAAVAYGWLFTAQFPAALATAQKAGQLTAYGQAIHHQVHALCTGTVPRPLTRPTLDPRTVVGAMAVFHTSEAAHVAGDIAFCTRLVQETLASGDIPTGPRTWLELALVRSLLFQGEVAQASDHLAAAERGPISPLARQSVQCLRAMIAGLGGDRAIVVEAAVSLKAGMTHPATYADAGLALLGAMGLAASGLPQSAADLLQHGGGGPGLPLLPLALRAYGYDLLVEAAVASGALDLAAWVLLDFDRLDLGQNPPLTSARETARARVRWAEGDAEGGRARSRAATASALESGSALIGARAAVVGGRPGQGDSVLELLESLTPVELRDWAVRTLKESAPSAPAPSMSVWERLTPAQRVVGRLAARGLRNHEIARTLVLSERTVESHVAAVLATFGVTNRIGIVARDRPAGALDDTALSTLTPRQRQVAIEVVQGRTNAQIAVDLGVSEKAIEGHLRALLRAFRVTSRAGVAAALLRAVDPEGADYERADSAGVAARPGP